MQSLTEQNTDQKNKYLIILSANVGFFSLFFHVLGWLPSCREKKMIPVVYFNRTCLYWSEKGYRGSRNVWEYYLEPLSAVSIKDIFDIGLESLEKFGVSDFKKINSS